MRMTRADRVRWMTLTCVFWGLLGSAVAQEDSPWGPETDAAVAKVAPKAPVPKPAVAPTPVAPTPAAPAPSTARIKAKSAPTASAGVPHSIMPGLDGAMRFILYGLVFLLAYLLPAIAFPALLRREKLRPGQAAALCIASGAVLIAVPGTLMLAATERFLAGKPVGWWAQSENYGFAFGGAFLLVALAAAAWFTRPARSEDW